MKRYNEVVDAFGLVEAEDGWIVRHDEAMHEITRLTLENEGLRKAMADCIEALDKARRTRVVLAKANDNG